jgi:hypothetical protein
VVWSRPPNSSPISAGSLRQLLGQVHGNLARPGNAGRALLAVRHLDLVVVGHRLLDVFHRDLAVLDRQQLAQRARQLDRHSFWLKRE